MENLIDNLGEYLYTYQNYNYYSGKYRIYLQNDKIFDTFCIKQNLTDKSIALEVTNDDFVQWFNFNLNEIKKIEMIE